MGIWAVPVWESVLDHILNFSSCLEEIMPESICWPLMEVHQGTCVNAISALLCLLYIQVTSLWSRLFLAVTNIFQQLCLVQTPVYMAESKKSTRAKLLPLVSFFNPLHKLELKADWGFSLEGAACSALLCDGQHSSCFSLGIPHSHFSLTFGKQNTISRYWAYLDCFQLLFLIPFSKIKTNFFTGCTSRLWDNELIQTPPHLPQPLAPLPSFCCPAQIHTHDKLDLVSDPLGILKQASSPKTCVSADGHWENSDFGTVSALLKQKTQFPWYEQHKMVNFYFMVWTL